MDVRETISSPGVLENLLCRRLDAKDGPQRWLGQKRLMRVFSERGEECLEGFNPDSSLGVERLVRKCRSKEW